MIADIGGYALIILFLTVLCGAPFVHHLNKNNIITKLSLSFVIGYTLLSLTGLLANAVGINPFFVNCPFYFFH